jgi:hypothetical protein
MQFIQFLLLLFNTTTYIAANANFIVFGLTWLGLELKIYNDAVVVHVLNTKFKYTYTNKKHKITINNRIYKILDSTIYRIENSTRNKVIKNQEWIQNCYCNIINSEGAVVAVILW